MKVLTIRQPWASLIMAGVKVIENRTWPIRQLGRLGIHAAARMEGKGWHEVFDVPELPAEEGLAFDNVTLPAWSEIPLGAILGTVEVYGCRELEDLPAGLSDAPDAGGRGAGCCATHGRWPARTSARAPSRCGRRPRARH